MAGNDFVQVQLTAAGMGMADGIPLRVSNGRRTLVFTPGQETRVERHYEWNGFLKHYANPEGELLFELAPVAAPVPAATPAPVAPVVSTSEPTEPEASKEPTA
ncbi:hypothetical protein FTO74_14415 [Granulicella sp. WH15]|uniref:hypothetical protein n=1 Tax=Granulicella sp. WH15 TaxID=2602070 RepID=UPI0013668ADD|nr:hypothetical protein [Granulicella sp. WH15]QHN04426.1 hypothetical protein FTO74_14415 [Granulicella sp. WH15]